MNNICISYTNDNVFLIFSTPSMDLVGGSNVLEMQVDIINSYQTRWIRSSRDKDVSKNE
jgi:hypothetical protein